LNWEKEESDASPFQTINAVEEAVSQKVHGDAMNAPSELAELGLWATIRSATGQGGSGKGDEAHLGAKSQRKRLGTAASRGGRRGGSCATSQNSREMRESEEEKMRGGGSGFGRGRGRSPLHSRDTRGGERGHGGRLRRLLLRERNSGATVWGRG